MRKIINFRFTYPVIFGLIFGILSAYFLITERYFAIILLPIIFICIYFLLFFQGKKSIPVHLSIFALFFILGFSLLYLHISRLLSLELPNGIYCVTGKVTSVRYYDSYSLVTLSNTTLDNGYKLTNATVLVSVDSRISLEIGNRITCLADMEFACSDLSNFYYLTERISFKGVAMPESVEILSTSRNLFENVNYFIKNAIFDNMSYESAGVCYALLTGNVSTINGSTQQTYRLTGVSHIFSVSGLHISFLAHLIYKITKKVNIPQIIKSLFTIGVISFYCGVCSFATSAIRAVIMCSFLLLTSSFGKKYDIINSALLSYAIILIVAPLELFSVGCLLSYSSLLGIIVLARPIKGWFKFLPEKISGAISVSLSATFATLPITLNVFGYFSPLSLLYNLIIVPAVYVVFLMLIIFVLISIIFSKHFLFALCQYVVEVINKFIAFTKPSRFIVKGTMAGFATGTYYLGLIAGSDLIFIKRKNKILLSVGLFALSLLIIICI